MYTEEEKKKAILLLIQYDLSPTAVIRELGYPCRTMLYNWYHQYQEIGSFQSRESKSRKYSAEQREAAVNY